MPSSKEIFDLSSGIEPDFLYGEGRSPLFERVQFRSRSTTTSLGADRQPGGAPSSIEVMRTRHGIVIPELLRQRELVIPLEEYSGKSERIRHLRDGIQQIQSISADVYGNILHRAQVTVLTHKLYQEWQSNDYKLTDETIKELNVLLERSFDQSETGKLAIRHAFGATNGPGPQGKSFMALEDSEQVLDAIYQEFELSRDQDYETTVEGFEGALNLQEFIDPTDDHIYEEESDGTLIYTGDKPAVGGVATTGKEGEITIHVAIGDNRATSIRPKGNDMYKIKSTTTPGSKRSNFKIIDSRPGSREHMLLDRNDAITLVKLPVNMRQGFISKFDDGDAIKVATAAWIGKGILGQDCKIEFAIGKHGVTLLEFTEYAPPEALDATLFAPKYETIATLRGTHDTLKLDPFLNGSASLSSPPVVLLPFSELTGSTTGLSEVMQKLESTIDKIKENASQSQLDLWGKLLLIMEGTVSEHRGTEIMRQSPFQSVVIPRLPTAREGDVLAVHWDDSPYPWIRNTNLSGDGIDIIATSEWPDLPSHTVIGNKSRNQRAILDKLHLPTPPDVTLTKQGFLKILASNNLLGVWTGTEYMEKETKMLETFRIIHNGLTSVPPDMLDQLTTILQRQAALKKSSYIIARSSSPLEDRVSGRAFHGAFHSSTNIGLDELGPDLEQGILEVIKSLFTPSLARLLASLPESERLPILKEWYMPVLSMPQLDTKVSGTVFHADMNAQDTSVITIQAELGMGGVVSGPNGNNTLTIMVNAATEKIKSVSLTDKNRSTVTINPEDIQSEFSPYLDLGHIQSLAKAAITIKIAEGKPHDTEFTIDKNGDIVYVQTRSLYIKNMQTPD